MSKTPKNAVSEEAVLKAKAFDRYVSDALIRFKWLSITIAIAELILMILDFIEGFFSINPMNKLNLVAELLLILSSLAIFIQLKLMKKKEIPTKKKIHMIISYRTIIMLAVLMFSFTDIYVREKILGTYMVFLFVLQITPAYKCLTNWLQFGLMGVIIMALYCIFIDPSPNTLFGTLFIFLSFAVSTDALRRYFTRQLENYFRAENATKRFTVLSTQAITALSNAVEAKDLYTKGHSQRVASYSELLAQRLGYPENKCREVRFIGLMHDVGKIGIKDEVINKKGLLNDEEYAEIKMHPEIGSRILSIITELPGISEGARWHHERYDGKGYPDGLSGENIPEIARIIAVADAYDAMTSTRSYRKLMTQAEVREQISTNLGTQFDPKIGTLMLNIIDEDKEYRMHE